MLNKIVLKFTEEPQRVALPSQGITVFVGPNNSGKSLVLRELERAVSENPIPSDLKLVADFEIDWPDTAPRECRDLPRKSKTQID